MDRFLVRMWDSKYKKMWTFENDGFLECVFECLKQQLAYESKLKVLENISYNHIADGRIFMQCTGLKDTNGKLIYEGDILEIKWKNDDYPRYYQVKFEDGAFGIEPLECNDWLDSEYISDISQETLIIGNIHENPELLEEK